MQYSPDSRLQRNYHQLAWTILLGAFMLFVLLATFTCYGLMQLRTLAAGQPEQPATLSTFTRGVDIYRQGYVQPEQPTPPQTTLYEGDSVVVSPNLPPGVAATIQLFDGSTIDLWPGTELMLEQVQTTRFSTHDRQVGLDLKSGLVQLKLAPVSWRGYDNVQYTLRVKRSGHGLEQATLEPEGIYRVRILQPDAPTTSASENQRLIDTLETEYVALRGSIALGFGSEQAHVEAGQKVRAVDEHLTEPLPARWQFIRDGSFSQYTQAEYNNTSIVTTTAIRDQSTTWFVSGEFYGPNAIADGFFSIVSGCLERDKGIDPGNCVNPVSHVAQFRRSPPPQHTTSFKTVITQTVDVDSTPYEKLLLEFDGRIVEQTINRAGIIGEECALGIEVRYINIDNNPGSHTFCFYARDEDSTDAQGQPSGTISNKPYITSIKLDMGRWEHQKINVLKTIPHMRKLTSIAIYGNGHDYQSEVTNIQLLGQ